MDNIFNTNDYDFQYTAYKRRYESILLHIKNKDIDIKDLLKFKDELIDIIKNAIESVFNKITINEIDDLLVLKDEAAKQFFIFSDNRYPSLKINAFKRRIVYYLLYLSDYVGRYNAYDLIFFKSSYFKENNSVKYFFNGITFEKFSDAVKYIESKYYQDITILKNYFYLYFNVKCHIKQIKKEKKSKKHPNKLFVDKQNSELYYFPNRLPSAKNLILSGKLKDLYLSDKWECGRKYRNVQRSWKEHRKTQYKQNKSDIVDKIYSSSNLTIKEKLDNLIKHTNNISKINLLYNIEMNDINYHSKKNTDLESHIQQLLKLLKEKDTVYENS